MVTARGPRRQARTRPGAGDFTRSVVQGAREHAPKRLGPYRTSIWSSIGKLWTGNPDVHYEIWRRPKQGVAEIGLHFEADPLTNARLLAAFRARESEVRAGLGAAPLLEEWDRGWARVYEARPLSLAATDFAERLAAYVAALEPILRDELPVDVPWRPLRAVRPRKP